MSGSPADTPDRGLEYIGASRIEGPLVVVERVRDAGFDELVEITGPGGRPRLGRVLEISDERALVQVLEGTDGLSGRTVRARFLGESLKLPVSKDMLGRVFDGLGRPADGGPPPLSGGRRAWRTSWAHTLSWGSPLPEKIGSFWPRTSAFIPSMAEMPVCMNSRG